MKIKYVCEDTSDTSNRDSVLVWEDDDNEIVIGTENGDLVYYSREQAREIARAILILLGESGEATP